MKYCGMCGTYLLRACPSCAALNPLSYRFCGTCGTHLEKGGESIATPPASAAAESGRTLAVPLLEPENEPSGPLPVALNSERKVVTALITDVAGSTKLLEQVGNETWVELMNEVLQIQEREVYRYGGQVNQFRGDGLLAFFGTASTHEDDPERAVLASLSIQKATQEYARKLAEKNGTNLQIRIGVNSGEVIILSVGSTHQHQEDTAMGLAVAIAARMEASAEPGAVLVSEYTYRLVASQFEWQPLGTISVKGISLPIQVFRPLAPIAEEEQSVSWGDFDASIPLIGRDEEMQSLQGRLGELYAGRGGIVLLSGEGGVGKSFLINELRLYYFRQGALLSQSRGQRWQESPVLTWLEGRCRSYNTDLPYSMWMDLLLRWLGITQAGESGDVVLGLLQRESRELWGEAAGDYYPYLGLMLSLPLAEADLEKVRHLSAEGLRQQFSHTFRKWLEALTHRGPVVVYFADMQWADTSSLDLLKYCLPLVDRDSLLWIFILRPERTGLVMDFRQHVETHYPHRLMRLELPTFDLLQTRKFVNALLGSDTLPPEALQMVYKSSEGNPYYTLEIIRSLADSGNLVRQPDANTWTWKGTIDRLELPENMSRLLRARIDRLTQDERYVLQLASVIGIVFWYDLLRNLAGENFPLNEHLSALQRDRLIVERGQVPGLGMEYGFNSKLVRDVTYESLLSTQLSALHLQVADYLERHDLDGFQKQYESLIAYHYHRAGNPNKELFYTLRAADQASKVYANAEALDHCNRAVALLEKMECETEDDDQCYAIHAQAFEVLSLRLKLHYSLGSMEAGDADARELLKLAVKMPDDQVWLIDALLTQPAVQRNENRSALKDGLAMAERAHGLACQLGDRHREMNSLIAISNLRHLMHDWRWREIAEQALTIARQLGDLRTQFSLLRGIANALGMDNIDQAQGYQQEAIVICDQLNDKQIEYELIEMLAPQYERSGDYYRLLTEYEYKRLSISREIGDRVAEANSLMYCAQAEGLYLGDYDKGFPLAQEALSILEGMNSSLYPLLRMVQFQIAMEDFSGAARNLELAYPLAEQEVHDTGQAGYALVASIYHNQIGAETDLLKVLELTGQVRKMASEDLISVQYQMVSFCEASAAHLGLAKFAIDKSTSQEHLHQALEASSQALAIYNRFGFTQVIECTAEEIFYRHSQALAINGRQAESLEFLQRANAEMLRKWQMIPENSSYRHTYIEHIALHQEIKRLCSLTPEKRL